MPSFADLRFWRRLILRPALLGIFASLVVAGCSTSHESDIGANQDYADGEEPGGRPTLPMPAAAPTPAPAAKPKPKTASRPRPKPVVVARSSSPAYPRTGTKAGPSPKTIEKLASAPRKLPNYSPMVDRTATGVRVVKDFSSQATTKAQRDNAAAVKAYRAQQNAKMARAYNNNNLLTR